MVRKSTTPNGVILKSNMDRFIVVPIGIGIMAVMIFKIQYG